MKINAFNGGLDIRKSPLLIQPNEAVVCENVDTSAIVLTSSKDTTATTTEIVNKPFYFEAQSEWQDRSGALEYMEFGSKLYWTTTGRAQKYDGTDIQNLGITAPTTAPTVSATGESLYTSGAKPIEPEYIFRLSETTKTGAGAGVQTFTFTLNITVNSVIVKQVVETIYIDVAATSDVLLECRTDDSNLTLAVYTPADYSGVTVDQDGITPVVDATPPALGSDLFEDGEEITFAIALYNSLTTAITTPTEHKVTFVKGNHILLTGSHRIVDPVSYPHFIKFYIKLNDVYYEIDSVASAYAVGNPTVATSLVVQRETSGTTWTPSKLNGTYQYIYTYYNEDDGTESAPTPLSAEVNPLSQSVSLASLSVSSDTQVTHKRIYRVGGSVLSFTFVAEIANATTTYTDSTADIDLTGVVFDATLNQPPVDGLRYITEVFGTFFGALGTKLYFTRDIGNPNYWPSTYYIDFYSDITGIGVTATTIIVFTKYKAYAILGSSANTYSKRPLSGDQGCVNHDTIAELSGQLLFMSTDGICMTSGGEAKVISKHKLGKQDLSTTNALIYDEVYYCQLADNTILAFDFRYEPSIKYFDFNTDFLVSALDVLYGRVDDSLNLLHTLFSGSETTYTYTTGRYTEGSASFLKTYNILYLSYTGTHTLAVYIDGTLVNTYTLTDQTEIKLPADSMQGYDIQFALTGIGTFNEIEYAPYPRQKA